MTAKRKGKTRRFLAAGIILVLAGMFLLFPALAEEELGGEMFKLRGYTEGTLRFESIYLDPHDGPGYEYFPVSLDLPRGAAVQVLTQAVDTQGNRWVLVDAGNIRAYLVQEDYLGRVMIDCDLSDIPMEPSELWGIWNCLVYEDTLLLYGPGDRYEPGWFTVTMDDMGYVILMNGDWALVEYQGNEDGSAMIPEGRKTRGWTLFSRLCY